MLKYLFCLLASLTAVSVYLFLTTLVMQIVLVLMIISSITISWFLSHYGIRKEILFSYLFALAMVFLLPKLFLVGYLLGIFWLIISVTIPLLAGIIAIYLFKIREKNTFMFACLFVLLVAGFVSLFLYNLSDYSNSIDRTMDDKFKMADPTLSYSEISEIVQNLLKEKSVDSFLSIKIESNPSYHNPSETIVNLLYPYCGRFYSPTKKLHCFLSSADDLRTAIRSKQQTILENEANKIENTEGAIEFCNRYGKNSSCVSSIAEKREDPEICASLTYIQVGVMCLDEVFRRTKSVEVCKYYHKDDWRLEKCYQDAIVR